MSKGRHAREEKRFVDERKQAVGGLDFCGQVCHSFTDNSIMHDIEFATMQPRRLCNTLAGYCAQRADGLIQLQHAGGKRHFISSVGRTHSLLLSIDHIFLLWEACFNHNPNDKKSRRPKGGKEWLYHVTGTTRVLKTTGTTINNKIRERSLTLLLSYRVKDLSIGLRSINNPWESKDPWKYIWR